MNKRPHIIFPKPKIIERDPLPRKPQPNFHYPSKERQWERIGSKINELDNVLKRKSLALRKSIAGAVPEMVLVLEIAGSIENFFNAVKKTPHLEFLAEYACEFERDTDFYFTDDDGRAREKSITGQIFLVMTNQKALYQLKSYWDKYNKGKVFKHGTNKFKTLFEQLKEIRPYSIRDRLRDTGFEDFLEEEKKHNKENVRFEIEFFYRDSPNDRQRAVGEIKALLNENGGAFIEDSETVIKEIAYHAFIADVPISLFDDLTENTSVSFLQYEQVMFFRPLGQIAIDIPRDSRYLPDILPKELPLPEGEPVVALLDGLPLANHSYLANRLMIDDPDGFESSYSAGKQFHGTAMASLIIHGELDDPNGSPLKNPVYVRPVMKPDEGNRREIERIPPDRLPVDLIHRTIRRLFEGEGDIPPVSPSIKIVNLSIGDYFRPFLINISSWAKLLDWLAYKYKILFVVSTGNYTENVELKIDESSFNRLDEKRRELLMVESIVDTNFKRKILTPAETLNSLTVGAVYSDLSTKPSTYTRNIYPIKNPHLLAPFSRIGFGYNGMIKPEILMPGGRLPYRVDIVKTKDSKTVLTPILEYYHRPPGQRVAMPGQPGEWNKTGFLWGTSNAAALTSRLGAQIYQLLVELNNNLSYQYKIPSSYFSILIKALIVHGAEWGNAKRVVNEILKKYEQIKDNVRKKHVTNYLGYGRVNRERILYCTDQRVTLVGWGELKKDEAHIYSFPLPYSLSEEKFRKRLTITLAWFTPVNIRSNKYRQAQLFFDNYSPSDRMKKPELTLDRSDSPYDMSKKGTVQHDVLEGEYSDAFLENANFTIRVNCKEDASGLSKREKIKYGIAVTLEIDEKVRLPIYEEVLQRIRQRIKLKKM